MRRLMLLVVATSLTAAVVGCNASSESGSVAEGTIPSSTSDAMTTVTLSVPNMT